MVAVPRGKTLGGSSSINGHVHNRGQRMDFDSWAQLGNSSWGYSDVLPYFKRCEEKIGEGDELYRGKSGNLKSPTLNGAIPFVTPLLKGPILSNSNKYRLQWR